MALAVVQECAHDAELVGRFDDADRMRLAVGHILEVKHSFHRDCGCPAAGCGQPPNGCATTQTPLPCQSWQTDLGGLYVSSGWRVALLLFSPEALPRCRTWSDA